MGFRPGSFATIWSVEPGTGNFSKVRMSISRKNKDTGVYEDEFSGFVMFIGEAHAKAGRLKERDRIKLGDVDVTRRYDKERTASTTTSRFSVLIWRMLPPSPETRFPIRLPPIRLTRIRLTETLFRSDE